jgi:hypothetical protein
MMSDTTITRTIPSLETIESDYERGVALIGQAIALNANILEVEAVTPEFAEVVRQYLLTLEVDHHDEASVAFCLRLAARGEFEKAGSEILGHMYKEGAALRGMQIAVMTTKERQAINGQKKKGYKYPVTNALEEYASDIIDESRRKGITEIKANDFVDLLARTFRYLVDDGLYIESGDGDSFMVYLYVDGYEKAKKEYKFDSLRSIFDRVKNGQ